MGNILNALHHVLYYADREQQIWMIVLLLVLIALAVSHHFVKEDEKMMRIWMIGGAVPMIMCVIHCFIYCAGYAVLIPTYLPMYILGFAPIPGVILAKRKIGFRVATGVSLGISCVVGMLFCATITPIGNFTRMGYVDSFNAMIDEFEEHYVLAEWKGLDFEQLRAEYLPEVEQAERDNDPAAFVAVVRRFVIGIGDGHVGWSVRPDKAPLVNYHEYGLASIMLSSGEIIAINTGDVVNALGIHDGTVITRWDGKPVDEFLEEMGVPYPNPVASNAKFAKSFYLTSVGGETVEVSFIDDNGKEQTTQLERISDTSESVRAVISTFAYNKELDKLENFSTRMLNDRCGYLRISSEQTDSSIADVISYLTGVHRPAMKMFKEKLDALTAEGMEMLIIDIRDNGGGLDEISLAITSLLSDEERFGIGLAVGRGANCRNVVTHNILAEGSYSSLPVLVLTDMECASAGDGLVLYLSQLPNVTVAGITDPCGCNQETGGACYLLGGDLFVYYPAGLVLDADGNPNIDTKADGISRNPVDVRIPLDTAAALQMIAGEGDYELEWAIQYLEQNR